MWLSQGHTHWVPCPAVEVSAGLSSGRKPLSVSDTSQRWWTTHPHPRRYSLSALGELGSEQVRLDHILGELWSCLSSAEGEAAFPGQEEAEGLSTEAPEASSQPG